MRLYDEYFCTNSSDIYKEILNKMGMTSWAEEERAYVPSIKAEYVPSIKKVIFNNPATIVFWNDGTKTTVKCSERDEYSEEVGLAMAISKKAFGNKGNFNEVFKKYIPTYCKAD